MLAMASHLRLSFPPECFGTIWIKPKRNSRHKPRPKKEMEELFKEHLDDLLEMMNTGSNYKDTNRKIWKMKEMVVGPKVGPAEPALTTLSANT